MIETCQSTYNHQLSIKYFDVLFEIQLRTFSYVNDLFGSKENTELSLWFEIIMDVISSHYNSSMK